MTVRGTYTQILLLLSLLFSRTVAQQKLPQRPSSSSPSSCEEGDSTCSAKREPKCGVSSRCVTGNPFYQRGGSAQAYKPNAPVKSDVCSASTRYKPATWPFSRSSRSQVPELNVNLTIYECKGKGKQCCCAPLDNVRNGNDGNPQLTKVEVWQAKPNGQYASLAPHREDGVCRATLPAANVHAAATAANAFSFATLAPGSTGVLGGLGPRGLDMPPYGPPALHVLVTSPAHEPLLVHLPIVLDHRNLKERSFFGPDLRGPAYVTPKIREKQYEVEQWTVEEDEEGESIISMAVNIYLHPTTAKTAAETTTMNLYNTMCPSSFYGSSTSFFLEPIAVCAPSMLNFFEL